MGYAFISYSTKNQTSADAIRELFTKHKIDTWMAPYNIPAGSKYAAVITKAIRECSCFVLLLSNDSQASEAVDSEVELAALTFKKSIITVELEKVVLNDSFTFYIHNKQIIAINQIDEQSLEIRQVLEAVKAYTGSTCMKTLPSQSGSTTDSNSATESSLNGKHTITLPSGDLYEGNYVEGRRTGKGTLKFTDGCVYEGDFLDGKRIGKGKLTWPNGDIYEGDFLDDKITGNGKLTKANGDIYECEFMDGKVNGKGKLTFTNGSIYEGELVDNAITGKGTFTYTFMGVVIRVDEGNFVNGTLNGHGKRTLPGMVYEGNFVNGEYIGSNP